jgi:hypothetical protein
MLDATMSALRTISPSGDADGEDAHVARRFGEAADGQVRAELGSDGRVESIWVDPRLMRLGSVELTQQIVIAVNAAIDSMRGDTDVPAVGDLSQLTKQLEQVRDTAVPRLGEFLRTLTDAQERLARGGAR